VQTSVPPAAQPHPSDVAVAHAEAPHDAV